MTSFTKAVSKYFGFLKFVPLLPSIIDQQLKVLILFFRPRVFIKVMDLNKWLKQLALIEVKYHKYGGLEYSVGGMEVCHIHSDGLVDLKSNKLLNVKYKNHENVEPHHMHPASNMLSIQLASDESLKVAKEIILAIYHDKIKMDL